MVNDPPVIDTNFTPMLPPIAMPQPKNAVIPGTPISKLLAHVTDVEGDPIGLALTGYDATHGQWQYSIDSGANWTVFPAVTAQSALVLTDDGLTQVRFLPNKASKGVKAFTKGFADHDEHIRRLPSRQSYRNSVLRRTHRRAVSSDDRISRRALKLRDAFLVSCRQAT